MAGITVYAVAFSKENVEKAIRNEFPAHDINSITQICELTNNLVLTFGR